jgi:hypothetical protein
MELSDGLTGVVGEDGHGVDLARLVRDAADNKVNAQLRVQDLDLVCRW